MQLCLSRSWGGLEMSALRFAQVLEPHGHTSVCVTISDSPLEDACKKAAVSATTVAKPSRLWPFGAILRLRRALIENKIDLVFVHHLKDLSFLIPALIGLKKIKLIGLSHVLVKRSKKDIFHRFLYSFLDRMIVFTNIQRELSLPVLPVPPAAYAVIPGFVDTRVFNPRNRDLDLRRSWGIQENEIVLGTIGRLDEQKGQAEFLQALSQIRSEAPDLKWKAVMIGAVTAGEDKKGYATYVQELLTELKLEDRVRMIGFLPDPSRAMASLDVFVLPSYKETFGLVILEAMASRVVPVVTDAGGPPEIIGPAGVKVLPKDATSLAHGLIQILRHPQMLEQLSVSALERAESVFSRETVGANLDRLVRHTVLAEGQS